jgi:hypothetical protein
MKTVVFVTWLATLMVGMIGMCHYDEKTSRKERIFLACIQKHPPAECKDIKISED